MFRVVSFGGLGVGVMKNEWGVVCCSEQIQYCDGSFTHFWFVRYNVEIYLSFRPLDLYQIYHVMYKCAGVFNFVRLSMQILFRARIRKGKK